MTSFTARAEPAGIQNRRGRGVASRLLLSWTMATGSTHTLGELCVGGDWACSNGDLETLGHIASCLAAFATAVADERLRSELATLVEICRCDPDRAVATWLRLRPRVVHGSEKPAQLTTP